MQRAEARQVLGELVHGEARRHQHAQAAARLRGGDAGDGLGVVHLAQDAAHALQVFLADVGQREPPRRAVDQARAQMLLELGDQPRGDGRRDVQRIGGLGEAAGIDDAGEDPHGAQLVHLILSKSAINNSRRFFIREVLRNTVNPSMKRTHLRVTEARKKP